MADPIDLLETPPTPDPTPDLAPAALPPGSVAISEAELAQLRLNAQAFENARPMLEQLRAQSQIPQPQPQPNATDTDGEFWTSPTATAKKLIADTVTPYARQMAAQLGQMVVNSFRSTIASDRFYVGTVPFFDKKLATIDKAWLGGLDSGSQQKVLNEAWLASKGAFLQDAENKRPVPPTPTNISGGSGGTPSAKPTGKRTLEQIDPGAYRMAVARGWSAERMAQIAADIELELENDR